jgi:hypothetical protein
MQRRIHWKEDEWKIVLNEAAKILQTSPHLTYVNAVKQAQAELPSKSRRRHIINLPAVREEQLKSLVKELNAKTQDEARPQKVIPEDSPKTLGEIFGGALDEALKRANEDSARGVAQVRQQLLMQGDLLGRLDANITSLRTLIVLLIKEMGSTIPVSLETPMENKGQVSDPQDSPAPMKVKTKIWIVGLKGDQRTNIRKNFESSGAEIKFMDQSNVQNSRSLLDSSTVEAPLPERVMRISSTW